MIQKVNILGLAFLAASSFSANAALAVFNYIDRPSNTALPIPAADWAENMPQPSGGYGVGGVQREASDYAYYSGWAAAPDVSRYIGFKFSADAGYQMNLASLVFTTGATSNSFPGERITSFEWGFRVDADNDGIYEQGWTMGKTFTAEDPDFETVGSKTFDFVDFSTAGTVEFGLFATGEHVSFSWLEGLRGLTFNGTTSPVPEPSALFLSALGGLVVLRRRR